MKTFLCLSLTVLFTSQVFASNVNPTKITKVLVGPAYGNNVFLTVSIKPSDAPNCQNNTRYSYVFDGTTEVGKMTLSVVLSAYASQKDVWLGGADNCVLHNGVESLKHIVAQ